MAPPLHTRRLEIYGYDQHSEGVQQLPIASPYELKPVRTGAGSTVRTENVAPYRGLVIMTSYACVGSRSVNAFAKKCVLNREMAKAKREADEERFENWNQKNLSAIAILYGFYIVILSQQKAHSITPN
jgi:hypothetical protein